MDTRYVKYNIARSLINEGDILLFRGKGFVGNLIARYGGGIHSHAALASWRGNPNREDSMLECVEFREWKGSRTVSLFGQVNEHNKLIDVYRPLNSITYDELNSEVNGKTFKLVKKAYTKEVANKVTDGMRKLTGKPYGWKVIHKMFWKYFPFSRLRHANMKDDDISNVYVCSTSVAFFLRKFYSDPVPNLADNSVVPADLGRSALLRYLFTLEV